MPDPTTLDPTILQLHDVLVKNQTNNLICDVCQDPLPIIHSTQDSTTYFDCFVHPYWVDNQIICPSCADKRTTCLACETTIHSSDHHTFCPKCSSLNTLLDFREAFTVKEFVLNTMKTYFKIDLHLIQLLQRIPVYLSNKPLLSSATPSPLCHTEWGFNNGTNILAFCQFNPPDKNIGIKQIVIRRGLPSILAVFVIAHELFHALLFFSSQIYLNLASSKHFLLKLAHDHTFNQLCQTPEEFVQIEEAAAHLFGSHILQRAAAHPSSQHEQALKTLWMLKVLPQKDRANEYFGPPLASYSVQPWNQAVKLNSHTDSPETARAQTFQSFLTILTQLKCIWSEPSQRSTIH